MRTCYRYLFLAKKKKYLVFWFLPGLNCLSFYLLVDAFRCMNSYFGQFVYDNKENVIKKRIITLGLIHLY